MDEEEVQLRIAVIRSWLELKRNEQVKRKEVEVRRQLEEAAKR